MKCRKIIKGYACAFITIVVIITALGIFLYPISSKAQILPKGFHSATEQFGVDWSLSYTAEVMSNIDGGRETETVYQGYLSLDVSINLEKLAGLKHTAINFNVIDLHGQNPSAFVGDDLLVSNISGAKTIRLQQLYLNFQTSNNKWNIKAGLLAVDEYYLTGPGSSLFMHGAAAYLLTLSPNAPAWPVASTALQFRYNLNDKWTFRMGAFDADSDNLDEYGTNPHGFRFTLQPDNVFMIAEASWNGSIAGKKGFYRLGAWHDTNKFPTVDGNLQRGLSSIYVVADQQLYTECNHGSNGFYLFMLAGWVFQQDRAPIDYDIRAGVYWKGLIADWDDVIAFIYAYPHVGDRVVVSNLPKRTSTESIWELTYQINLTEYLSIQGSVHQIFNPGGASARHLKNATVIGIRMNLSF